MDGRKLSSLQIGGITTVCLSLEAGLPAMLLSTERTQHWSEWFVDSERISASLDSSIIPATASQAEGEHDESSASSESAKRCLASEKSRSSVSSRMRCSIGLAAGRER
ncbi:MAG: hypothetical protein SGPRY_008031 [Prymnesium sp.]